MTFDPQAFLDAPQDDAFETEYTPILEGDYLAYIADVAARDPKGYHFLDVIYVVDDEGVRKFTGLPEPKVRGSFRLDLTESGGLAKGKNQNVELGRLQVATGVGTQPGQKWSPRQFVGRPVRIHVHHKQDKDNPSKVYAEVDRVTKR